MKVKRNYWVWVTQPLPERREFLTPGQSGWWTCHKDTKRGDLVLVYMSGSAGNIAYLVEASCDAYTDDPMSGGSSPWRGDYACSFISHVQFPSPLTLAEMRLDRVLSGEFSALRGNFQQRAYKVTPPVWTRLTQLLTAKNPATKRTVGRLAGSTVSRELVLEEQIEEALKDNLDVLRPEWKLKFHAKQSHCDDWGRMDLLCRDRRGWVVIELKRVRATGPVVSQTASYMGWVAEHLASAGQLVRGLVISPGTDHPFDYALKAVPNLYHLDLGEITESLGIQPFRH